MLFTLLGSFLACESETYCTDIFMSSVNLELLDETDSPITDADISYTVDGEEGENIQNFGNGEYAVGGEEAGDFQISIAVNTEDPEDECCWTEGTANLSLSIEADECHVIPQSITPELDWVLVCADSEDCG